MMKSIFKHRKDQSRFLYMHPVTLMIFFDMYSWCLEKKIEFKVTSTVSTIEEDEKLNRKSSSHRTGRAFDLSVRNMNSQQINEFRHVFNRKYERYGAVSKFTGKPTLIVLHDSGHGRHFHVQIHSSYAREIQIPNRK